MWGHVGAPTPLSTCSETLFPEGACEIQNALKLAYIASQLSPMAQTANEAAEIYTTEIKKQTFRMLNVQAKFLNYE